MGMGMKVSLLTQPIAVPNQGGKWMPMERVQEQYAVLLVVLCSKRHFELEFHRAYKYLKAGCQEDGPDSFRWCPATG